MSTAYDPNVDYQALINEAVKKGDYAAAAQYEQQRNQKIADMNAAGGGTNKYGATETYNYNSSPTTSLTDEEKEYYDRIYTHGGYTQDLQESIAHGGTTTPSQYFDGSDGWYYYDRGERNDYSDDADATFMSGSDYYMSTQNKNEWHRLNELKKQAQASGNSSLVSYYQALQDDLHAANEEIRSKYGYSGGVDGSQYDLIDTGNSGHYGGGSGSGGYGGSVTGSAISGSPGPGGSSGGSGGSSAGIGDTLKGYLESWMKTALEQSNGKIDNAVQQAVTELQRALEDAQPQFKEMAESVSRDEQVAMDNSALYAELRGDKGGIGQAQYNSIQNTAAQNRLAVQQAQTKLATDTERQIADLRAQGEFEKADAALEITQTYLAQLMSLEQWAAEYNLSVQEFQASLQQWEAEYQLALKQLEIGQSQWQQEFSFQQQQYAQQFAFQQQQYQDSLALNQQSQMANIAWSLLQSGVELDANQLKALGISADQATSMILQAQMKQKDKETSTSKPSSDQSVYEWLYNANAKDYGTAYEALRNAGFNTTDANRYAKYYTETWLEETSQNSWGDGYNTDLNVGGVKASEWAYVRNNILQGLMRKDFAAVEAYLDQVAAGFSEAQWNEIQELLDTYGFYSQKK